MRIVRQAFCLILLGLFLGLAVTEGTLRLIGFEYENFYEMNPVIGSVLRPGAHGWWREEGQGLVSINSLGMRDIERPIAKPPNTFRVAILGDSYAEALQVNREQGFAVQLESALGRCQFAGKKTIEVLNFGVSGFGTVQELLMYRERAKLFQPDVVLILFLSGNDLAENLPGLRTDEARPYMQLENGVWVTTGALQRSRGFMIRHTWWWRTLVNMAHFSRTLQLLNRVKNRWAQAQLTLDIPNNSLSSSEPGLNDFIYAPPRTPWANDAWQITEGLLSELVREIRANASEPLLVTATNPIQVTPHHSLRAAHAKMLGVADLLYAERRLEEWSRRSDTRIIPLAPRMQVYAEENQVYLHGFFNTRMDGGHWNAAGHALAAEIVGEKLCSL